MPPQSPQPPFQPQPGPQQPAPPQQPGQPVVQSNDYEFMMNPGKPPRQKLTLPGSSLPVRIAIVAGGIIILIIIFSIIKGLVTTPPFDTAAMIGLAQDQQEMVHLTSQAIDQSQSQQAALSQDVLNFSVTAKASLSSDQNQTVTYLKSNGKKVKSGTLNKKVSATTDEQLTTAASNSTYESTYTNLMQTALKNYQTALKQTFANTTGVKARQLLNQEYVSAQLLLQQLQASSASLSGS